MDGFYGAGLRLVGYLHIAVSGCKFLFLLCE